MYPVSYTHLDVYKRQVYTFSSIRSTKMRGTLDPRNKGWLLKITYTFSSSSSSTFEGLFRLHIITFISVFLHPVFQRACTCLKLLVFYLHTCNLNATFSNVFINFLIWIIYTYFFPYISISYMIPSCAASFNHS